MLPFLAPVSTDRPLRLLCLGAHSDDLEIGCGGTLLTLATANKPVSVRWVVLSASGKREREARKSAVALLRKAADSTVTVADFWDGFFEAEYVRLKEYFEALKTGAPPDIILTHRLEDRHQDHRLVAELTWNTFRDHVILEYEIPKYEGDLGQPGLYFPLEERVAKRKAQHLIRYFGSQRSKHWFEAENFLALSRVRGLECRAPSGFAEAFYARKLVFGGAACLR